MPEKNPDKGSEVLQRIEVEDLFGRLSYNIVPEPPADGPGGISDRLMLLYGDNGSGKTTILKLVWDLLSPATSRGHRSRVARTPFRRIALTLSDGTVIEAIKKAELVGDFVVLVHYPSRRSQIRVDYEVNSQMAIRYDDLDFGDISRMTTENILKLSRKYGQKIKRNDDGEYLGFLKDCAIAPIFLADDRIIYSDLIDEEETARAERRPQGDPDAARRSVSEEVLFCMDRLSQQLRQLTIGAQAIGSQNATSLYMDVLERLGDTASDSRVVDDVNLEKQIITLGLRNEKFEQLGFSPSFPAGAFLTLVSKLDDQAKQVAKGVLGPYFVSLEKRLDALQEAQGITQTLLDQANSFLRGKYLTFRPREGIRIVTDSDSLLDPTNLSSGERQLVLLLCYTMLARQTSRLFIIDEPELSLNIKWQRRIIDALLTCAANSGIQFIVATHSIELITGYRERLVRLANTKRT
ncbi:AAA family ATPase [Amycolatopsis eburnea]|uniref:ATPase AAA-type core domain-containing protein n=1 Tax=Amycolatopsis eburnea TaxID=2267691 RepID=A0A3R9E471_9PSEU|nr:AAA family ATPase [Amycolatopsis eburnea]RSD25713.1 hypothetical protein EIY87_01615 [Amycolatopsis eburnea]